MRVAHGAGFTRDALVTVGIGTAAGTVLGLSTLPFYGHPGDHLGNVFIGASVGLVAGLGVALYLLTTPDHDASHGPVGLIEEDIIQNKKILGTRRFHSRNFEVSRPVVALPSLDRTPFTQQGRGFAALAINLTVASF
jgi:hypothetical protein